MSDSKPLAAEEVNRLFDELVDRLERDEYGPPIDGHFPDGTYYEYDDDLNATVEVAPDGKRYIVEYKKGKGLVRVKDLAASAA